MEKGFYSIENIKTMLLIKQNQLLYYRQHDPYGNIVEIEFTVNKIDKEGLMAESIRYYTRGVIDELGPHHFQYISAKDYMYISKKSKFL